MADKEKVGGVHVSAPDWRERALGRVRSRQRSSSRSTNRKHGIYIFMDDPLKVLVDEAAFRRGISISGYVRRAMSAMIAKDLGLPFTEVCKYAALPNSYKQDRFGNRRPYSQDDGKEFGQWSIKELEE